MKKVKEVLDTLSDKGFVGVKQKVRNTFKELIFADDKEAEFSKFKLEQYNENLGIYPISELLQHRSYDPKTELYSTATGKGFCFVANPLGGIGEDKITQLKAIFQGKLPVGTVGQFLLHASPKIGSQIDEYAQERADLSDIMQQLAVERAKYCKKGAFESLLDEPFILRDYQLYISIHFDTDLSLSQDEIMAVKEDFINTLKTTGVNMFSLQPTTLMRVLDVMMRPNNSNYYNDLKWDPRESMNNQLCDPTYKRFVTSRKVGSCNNDWEISSYMVTDYCDEPPEIGAMTQIIGGVFDNTIIATPFSLSLIYMIADTDDEIGGFKIAEHNSQVRSRTKEGVNDMAREDSCLWQEVNSAQEAKERLVLTNFQIQLYTQGKNYREASIIQDIFHSKLGWKIVRNDFMHMGMFVSHLPLNQSQNLFSDLKKTKQIIKMWSGNIANICPILAEPKGMSSKKLMVGQRRGQISFFDHFSNDKGNYNFSVIGGSGAGKSVFLQELATSQLSDGRFWILDVGRSYYKLCKLLGGQFIVFNNKSDLCLNPFSVAKRETRDEFLQFISNFIFAMAFPKSAGENRAWYKATVEQIARKLLILKEEHGASPGIQEVIDELKLLKDNRAQDMAVQLSSYGRNGSYGKYFNGEGSLDVDGNFIVFELDELSNNKDLQNLIFMLLMHYLTEKMYLSDRKKRLTLVIDEAWDVLKGGHGAEIIEAIYRKARKYNGSVGTGTHSLKDYEASEAAKAAWSNSYFNIMMSQDKGLMEKAIKDGMLVVNAYEKKLLFDVHTQQGQYSELLIRGKSGEYMLGRLILDPFSKALYSTKAEEFARHEELVAGGLTTVEAVKQVAAEFYGYVEGN